MRALHGVRGVLRPLFLGLAASILTLAGGAIAGSAVAADVTLRQIMQDPDWIGPPVEAAWWQYGDDAYVYRVKRADTTVRDHYRRDIGAEDDALLDTAALGTIDGDSQVASRDGLQVISVHEGSLLLRDRRSGVLRRLYTGPEPVTRMQFAADESSVQFLVGARWWQVPLVGGAAWPVADLRFEDAPHAVGDDALVQEQLRLFTTLERERRHDWFLDPEWVGMALYSDGFAGDIDGLSRRLPYLQELGVNLLHVMPILKCPKGASDGGIPGCGGAFRLSRSASSRSGPFPPTSTNGRRSRW